MKIYFLHVYLLFIFNELAALKSALHICADFKTSYNILPFCNFEFRLKYAIFMGRFFCIAGIQPLFWYCSLRLPATSECKRNAINAKDLTDLLSLYTAFIMKQKKKCRYFPLFFDISHCAKLEATNISSSYLRVPGIIWF